MKKIYIITIFAMLCACSTQMQNSHEIFYSQEGDDCIYAEQNVTYIDHQYITGDWRHDKTINFERSVKYPNTKCDKVIDMDLKNAVNKTLVK